VGGHDFGVVSGVLDPGKLVGADAGIGVSAAPAGANPFCSQATHPGAAGLSMADSTRRTKDFFSWLELVLFNPPIPTAPYWLWQALKWPGTRCEELYICDRVTNGCYLVEAFYCNQKLILTESSRAAMICCIERDHLFGMCADSWLAMREFEARYP
jgi:hypothetical protein